MFKETLLSKLIRRYCIDFKAEKLLEDALAVQQAGAFSIVLEAVPSEIAKIVTSELSIPTIGIGAGAHCSGQVLVQLDMLGAYSAFTPK